VIAKRVKFGGPVARSSWEKKRYADDASTTDDHWEDVTDAPL